MSRWLITGAGGQVGAELAVRCPDAVALGHAELDVTDPEAVTELLGRHAPDVVVNAAGWTDVDGAETHVEPAMAANAVGPGLLAAACRGLDATLIHLSSDYVFDGKTSSPYAVDAPANPASAYGRSKLAGERAVLASGARAYVVRTAWVYAAGFSNFVTTMTRLADERETLEVADDQHGQPTWARDLAGALVALGDSDAQPGVYHCTNAGETTRCGLARAVFEEIGANPGRVRPTSTEAFPRPAPRPAYSVLSADSWRAGGLPAMRPWRDALAAAFAGSRAAPRQPGR